MSKLSPADKSTASPAKFDAAGNPITSPSAEEAATARAMGYGPSKVPFVEENLFSSQSTSLSPTLRFQHRIPYHGATIYATEVPPQEIAKIKNSVKKIANEERDLKRNQQQLQVKYTRVQQEVQALCEEQADPKVSEERFAEIEARLTQAWAEQDAIEAELTGCSDQMESIVDNGFQIMAEVAKNHIVAASYKENGQETYIREVEFTSKKARNEVAQIIVDLSRLTVSEHANLNGR